MGNWCTCSDQRIAADRDRNALSHDAGNADVGNAYGRDAWGLRGYADDGHDADDGRSRRGAHRLSQD